MQIQNFDLGMAALRPMVATQEMDIRAAQEGRAREEHPYQLKRLSALADWDVTRAAEKRTEMESDANLTQYLQGFKPSKEGLPYQEQLGEMSAGLLRQGKVNEAKKLADLSIGIESAQAMAEQREATAEMRRTRAQREQYTMWNQTLSAIDEGNVGDILARVKQQGMPEEDLARYAKMAQTPQGRATIRKMALSWKDMMAVEQRGEAQVALERDRAARLKRLDASLGLQAQGVRIRERLAAVTEAKAAADAKNSGLKVPDVTRLDLELAQSYIKEDEEFLDMVDMTPGEARNYSVAVASRAEYLRSRNPAMSKDEAISKAHEEAQTMLVDAPDGKLRTWVTQTFGAPPSGKKTFKGPPKTAEPAVSGPPPGSKLIGVAKGTNRRVWQTPDGKKIVED
jgi:hypothetical protein